MPSKVVDENVSQITEVYLADSSLAGINFLWAKDPLLFFNKIAVALEHATNGSSIQSLRATGTKADTWAFIRTDMLANCAALRPHEDRAGPLSETGHRSLKSRAKGKRSDSPVSNEIKNFQRTFCFRYMYWMTPQKGAFVME